MATSRNRSLEPIVVLLVGVLEMGSGIILALVAALGSFFGNKLPEPIPSFLSNVGIGLTAAGIMTLSVDALSRRRQNEYLTKLRDAHFESILKGFLPSPLFEEIKSQIIMQPFMSSDFHAAFDMEFRDATKKHLVKMETSTWEVKNVGSTEQLYELRVSEGWETFEPEPEEIGIEYIRVERHSGKWEELDCLEIGKRAVRNGNFVRLVFPIVMAPGEQIRILLRTKNLLPVPGEYNLHLTRPTVNLRVNISFPKALGMTVVPIHPARDLLRKELDSPKSQQWNFPTVFLPFQGVRVFWEEYKPDTKCLAATHSSDAQPVVAGDAPPNGGAPLN